jgi:drug/metabolite transporter (DMT)-like permease
MALWLLITLTSAIFSWLSSFAQKIAVENKTDAFFLILAQAVWMISLSWVYLLFVWGHFLIPQIDTLWIFFLILLLSCSQFFVIRIRAEALRYLSSSEYFISFRVLIVILLTWLGLVLFDELLSLRQIGGLLIGFLGIGLLFEEDKRLQHSRNWLRALYLLWLSILLGATIQISAKYLTISTWDIVSIIFYQGLFLLILACIFYGKKVLLFHRSITKKDTYIGLFFSVTIYIAAITNFFAFYYHWPVGIVSKILGYSVFIPIILSMVFYHEKMSYKKWIAFILTIISIYYLN